jgi:Mor family transcriptional regulator
MNYQKQRQKWAKRREEMRALFKAGWTGPKLAQRYKIKVQRVYQIVGKRKNGIDYQGQK